MMLVFSAMTRRPAVFLVSFRALSAKIAHRRDVHDASRLTSEAQVLDARHPACANRMLKEGTGLPLGPSRSLWACRNLGFQAVQICTGLRLYRQHTGEVLFERSLRTVSWLQI